MADSSSSQLRIWRTLQRKMSVECYTLLLSIRTSALTRATVSMKFVKSISLNWLIFLQLIIYRNFEIWFVNLLWGSNYDSISRVLECLQSSEQVKHTHRFYPSKIVYMQITKHIICNSKFNNICQVNINHSGSAYVITRIIVPAPLSCWLNCLFLPL